MDSSGTGHGHMAGYCEHKNESLGSLKCGEFLKRPQPIRI